MMRRSSRLLLNIRRFINKETIKINRVKTYNYNQSFNSNERIISITIYKLFIILKKNTMNSKLFIIKKI